MTDTSNSLSICPDCGEPMPPDSPQALCPTCLMRQPLASRTIADEEDAPAALPPLTPEELGEKFPGYEIIECLGRGGMGVVYKARQKSLNRIVAIKILAPERGNESRFADRFTREAELLAKLNHPHIVTIHDFGDTGGLFFLVMEFVDGVNLRDLLRDGKLEPDQALAIVPPICEALQYAHDKGIVHRDIKPENLLLDRDGRVKIADFGIASLVGASGESAGTPPYMAPEQSEGRTDHRADIYALGVVLYEMLTGERPAKDVVAPSQKVQVDVRLDGIVLRALEKLPELRYHSAGEFRTVVETIAPQASTAPPEVAKAPVYLVDPWKDGFAAAVTFFYSFEFLRILAMQFASVMLPLSFIHDYAYLLIVSSGLALVIAPFVGMAVTKALRQVRVDAEDVRWKKLAVRLKATSVVAWLLAAVKIGYAIFLMAALSADRREWYPEYTAAVLWIFTFWGVVLLPISGRLLWLTANAGKNGSKPNHSYASKAGLMMGKVMVGTRSGQRVIVWPAVVAFFLLVLILASLGVPFLAAMRVGWTEVFAINILGAAIMTGVGIVSGLKAPLDQLTDLDHSQSQNHPTSSAANRPSRSTGQTIALGNGVFLLVGMLMAIMIVVGVFLAKKPHFKTANNNRSQLSANSPLAAPDKNPVTIKALKFTAAEKVAALLNEMEISADKVEFDTRTNSLILKGDAKLIAQLAADLDQPEGHKEIVVRTDPFQHTNAEAMAEKLRLLKLGSVDAIPDKQNNSLVLKGNPTAVATLKKLLSDLDIRLGETQTATPALALAITPSLLAEPPKLQFLAWQDEWSANQPQGAWKPDGSPVTDATELDWLRDVGSCVVNVRGLKLNPEPRFLHLWFSHPLFSRSQSEKIALLDADGKPIELGGRGSLSSGSQDPGPNNGQLGWKTWSLSPGTAAEMPSSVTVQLHYTLGDLEQTQDYVVSPDTSTSMSLEGGSQVNGVGQDVDGQAFLAIAVDVKGMNSRRFGVIAVAKDGREITHTGSSRSGAVGGNVSVESFSFGIPLADVSKFVIGTRPIRTHEWKNVALRITQPE